LIREIMKSDCVHLLGTGCIEFLRGERIPSTW